ncbi:hypothetical protein NHX12_005288 [Muraenolepis orangiensis]|uniref:Ig-like domain-containing protein n=1 Tax=Muraenolepis orangiensis TaxID=630683 RepID=A0A9Q0DQE4_9TELE|nr:hypothetical protein NHX12_005288 [Muraenolepis orangiensis]
MVLTHYSTGPTDISPLYEGRATLDHDLINGKADLKLRRITMQDNKVFECRVQIPHEDEGKLADTTRVVVLDLKLRGITMQDNKVFKCRVLIPGDDEGKLADLTNVVVLVAPSTPVCKIEGKAEYGQNINLTCRSEEGSPTPVYSWAQQDVRQTPRIAAPRTTDKGGVLSLFNVSMETSGYYTCTSKNKIRSASCNITLTVSPPSMNMGATAGLIGGGVAALLVLGIVIYCCLSGGNELWPNPSRSLTPGEGEFQKEPEVNGERRDDRAEDDRSEAGTARRDYDDRRNDRDAPRSDYDAPRSDYDAPRSDYDDRRSEFSDRRSDYDDRRDRNDPRNDDRADRRRDDYRDEDNREDRRRDDYRDEDDREDSRRRDDYEDSERGGRPEPPRVPGNKPPSRGNYDV